MKRLSTLALVLMLCLSAAALSGCYRRELPENQRIRVGDGEGSGNVTEDNPTVALGAATSLDAKVRMGAGSLGIEVVGSDALDADFEYRPTEIKPEVDYEVSKAGLGVLSVVQPDVEPFRFPNWENSWDLRLSEDVPLDLVVDLGAGEADLKLGDSGLRTLSMNMGAGDATLDFGGEWANDVSGQVQAGVGQLTLRLPEDVGVRIDTHGSGIGAVVADNEFDENGSVYTNRAYGETSATIEVSVQRGIGEVRLESVR